MNAPLRKAGVVMMVLFGLLFAQLNWVQVVKADQYRNDVENNQVRVQQQEYERQRGNIIVDGEFVVEAGRLTKVDEAEVLRLATQARLRLDASIKREFAAAKTR